MNYTNTLALLYNSFPWKVLHKEINLYDDPLFVMLCTDEYELNVSHQYKSNITHEVVGSAYPPGGVQLSNIVVLGSVEDNDLIVDPADTYFPAPVDYQARYAIVYDAKWEPGTFGAQDPLVDLKRPLIAVIDCGENVEPTTGRFIINWHRLGMIAPPSVGVGL